MKTFLIIINVLALLMGIYAILAASNLEGISTTITKQQVVGAYCFFGGIIITVSIANMILFRIALRKTKNK